MQMLIYSKGAIEKWKIIERSTRNEINICGERSERENISLMQWLFFFLLPHSGSQEYKLYSASAFNCIMCAFVRYSFTQRQFLCGFPPRIAFRLVMQHMKIALKHFTYFLKQ